MSYLLLSALSAFVAQSKPALPAELQPLKRSLEQQGFQVKLAIPPVRGAYGVFRSSDKTIWIAPVTIPLGIVRQTFLHEAAHAVQSCPTGVLSPIGWDIQVEPAIEREITAILLSRYKHANRALEREAFFLQGRPDAVALLMAELKKRC